MDKLSAALGKKPRIVYTDKPVFKVSDPNDPIKYVMRDQGSDLEPKQEVKTPLASFLEEKQGLAIPNKPSSVARESGSVMRESELANTPAKGFFHNDFFVDAEELPPEMYDRLQALANNSQVSANQRVDELNQIRRLTQDPAHQEMLNEYEQVLNEETSPKGFQKLRGMLDK